MNQKREKNVNARGIVLDAMSNNVKQYSAALTNKRKKVAASPLLVAAGATNEGLLCVSLLDTALRSSR